MSHPSGPQGPQGPHQPRPGGPPPPGGAFPPQGPPPQGPPPQGPPPQGPPPQGGYGPPQGLAPQGPPPGQFGHAGHGHPGGHGPHPGQQKKSPLPWILGGVGALVIGGVVVLLIVLLGGDDKGGGSSERANAGTPEGAAQALVTALNDKNADGIADLTCEKMKAQVKQFAAIATDIRNMPGMPADLQGKMDNVEASFALNNVEKTSETQAKAHINMKLSGLPPEAANHGMKPEEITDFPLLKQGDKWELCQ